MHFSRQTTRLPRETSCNQEAFKGAVISHSCGKARTLEKDCLGGGSKNKAPGLCPSAREAAVRDDGLAFKWNTGLQFP